MRNANSNLSMLEKSAIPGASKLVGMISRADKKNTIILALVVAICFAILLNGLGLVDLLQALTPSFGGAEQE